MRKLIFTLLAAFALAASSQAQSIKLGHINSAEIIEAMPVMKTAKDSLQRYSSAIEKQYGMMGVEYETLLKEYNDLPKNAESFVKEDKEKQLLAMQQRIKDFEDGAQQKVAKKQEELVQPILKKIQDAIKAVAEDGKYTYIFDSTPGGSLLYQSTSTDISADVKRKLGI
jgi:outer membrane protein